MSGPIGMDLRYPIGALFTALGLILTVFGLATAGNADMYARSTAINVNLWWGLVMLAFGLIFLALARRAEKNVSS